MKWQQKFPFFLFLVLNLILINQANASPKSFYVTVREAKLRPRAEFFVPSNINVYYGDKLDVLSDEGAWLKVRNQRKQEGYIHKSALSERRVVLKASAVMQGGQANQNDIVLAGKGFSAEVEKQYAAEHNNLNFAAVDSMERAQVSDQTLANFISAGQLGKKKEI